MCLWFKFRFKVFILLVRRNLLLWRVLILVVMMYVLGSFFKLLLFVSSGEKYGLRKILVLIFFIVLEVVGVIFGVIFFL